MVHRSATMHVRLSRIPRLNRKICITGLALPEAVHRAEGIRQLVRRPNLVPLHTDLASVYCSRFIIARAISSYSSRDTTLPPVGFWKTGANSGEVANSTRLASKLTSCWLSP